MADFVWTKQRKEAAYLLGTSRMTVAEIAAIVGVDTNTLKGWRKRSAFQERVQEVEDAELELVKRLPYSRKAGRIKALNDELMAIDDIYEARGHDFRTPLRPIDESTGEEEDEGIIPDEARRTGGGTGRIVRRYKGFGGGPFLVIKREYEVDTATMKERRELMKHLAMELGEWQERDDPHGATGSISIIFEEREDGPQ